MIIYPLLHRSRVAFAHPAFIFYIVKLSDTYLLYIIHFQLLPQCDITSQNQVLNWKYSSHFIKSTENKTKVWWNQTVCVSFNSWVYIQNNINQYRKNFISTWYELTDQNVNEETLWKLTIRFRWPTTNSTAEVPISIKQMKQHQRHNCKVSMYAAFTIKPNVITKLTFLYVQKKEFFTDLYCNNLEQMYAI
jgi:hypothetical protein